MQSVSTLIAKRNPNDRKSLEVGKQYKVVKMSGLYHWDTKYLYGSPYSQGTTYCFKRGEIVTYMGEEDEKPLFKTSSGYIGIFRPTIWGKVPSGALEPV